MTGNESVEDELAFEVDLAQPPETVWQALTRPEILAEWLGRATGPVEEGARFSLEDEGSRIDCEVLAVEAGRLVRYAWRDERGVSSVVSFELQAGRAGGSILRIVHGGFRRIGAPSMIMAANSNAPAVMLRAA